MKTQTPHTENTAWQFVEQYYPNYSSCQLIAESNDLAVIVEDGSEGSVIRKAEFSETTEKAKKAMAIVDEEIYRKSIESFQQSSAAALVNHFEEHVIKLEDLKLIPLSSQLVRITGDHWTDGDYINLSGENEYGKLTHATPNTVIQHVKTGLKFLIPDNVGQVKDLKEEKRTTIEFTADVVAKRCNEVGMPLSPNECQKVADFLIALMDGTLGGIKQNCLDEAIVYAHSASELLWEPIRYRYNSYWLRKCVNEDGFSILIAPTKLYDAMVYDTCGSEFNKDASSLDDTICFYATDEEISLPNNELLKLIYDEQQSASSTKEA